jgi:7-cyano-7-deazaguanine synthase
LKKAVCILSGGMDSTLVSYIAKNSGYEIITVHFNYGQRTEKKELEAFRAISEDINAYEKYEIDLDFFKQIGASALTDKSIDVPTGGIEDGIPITYVPFRNGIFLSIATAIAEKHSAEAIYIGVVEEDSSGYPDCRNNFIDSMSSSINLGTKDDTNLKIVTPLIDLKKSQIVKKAIELDVPLELTWSCYQDEDEACGVCDSCRLRLKGFAKAGEKDRINYKK